MNTTTTQVSAPLPHYSQGLGLGPTHTHTPHPHTPLPHSPLTPSLPTTHAQGLAALAAWAQRLRRLGRVGADELQGPAALPPDELRCVCVCVCVCVCIRGGGWVAKGC